MTLSLTNPPQPKLKVLDLFSGIGGFSLGLERTGGFETVAFCEIEEFPRKVLAKHWQGVPIYEDVRKLKGNDVGPVDVICGGFPCQDISVAGRGEGMSGERSGLWSEIARLVGELRPRFVVVENVAALLGRGLGDVLGDLAAVGYDCQWHSIPASALGACHHRDRIWIVAYPAEIGACWPAESRFATSFGQRLKWLVEKWEAGFYPDTREAGAKGGLIQSLPGKPELSWGQNCRSVTELVSLASIYTPALCRTNDGVPNRVDRTGALGNAVVPQIPELIGHAILEAERQAAA